MIEVTVNDKPLAPNARRADVGKLIKASKRPLTIQVRYPEGEGPRSSSPAAGGSAAGAWASQLSQLHELGLTDDDANVRALEAHGGDVNAAVSALFG